MFFYSFVYLFVRMYTHMKFNPFLRKKLLRQVKGFTLLTFSTEFSAKINRFEIVLNILNIVFRNNFNNNYL